MRSRRRISSSSLVLLVTIALAGCGNEEKSIDAFYDEFFASQGSLSTGVDTSSISDGQLLAGGREVCSGLADAVENNRDEFVDPPTYEDLQVVVEKLANARFASVDWLTKTTGRTQEGAREVMALQVASAAAKHLCPEYEKALS